MTQGWVTDWLSRLGVKERPDPSLDTLAMLIRRQLQTFTFENADAFCGLVPRLDAHSLQSKLIVGQRGGYCFELNGIMALGLSGLGFDVTHRLARVLWQRSTPGPWTHHVLNIALDGQMWLVDVGFGGPGPDTPVVLNATSQNTTPSDLRLSEEPGLGTLLSRRGLQGDWKPLYAFGTDSVGLSDLENANWLAATFPESIFRNDLIVAKGDTSARGTLGNRRLRRWDGMRETESRDLTTGEDILQTLETEFGLRFSATEEANLLRRLLPGT